MAKQRKPAPQPKAFFALMPGTLALPLLAVGTDGRSPQEFEAFHVNKPKYWEEIDKEEFEQIKLFI